jgi:hypothetical protein
VYGKLRTPILTHNYKHKLLSLWPVSV